MEIKHYTLYQGLERNLLYTCLRLGTRYYYLERKTWRILQTTAVLCLTFAAIVATI